MVFTYFIVLFRGGERRTRPLEMKSSHETQNMNENSRNGQISRGFLDTLPILLVQRETSEEENRKILICFICFIDTARLFHQLRPGDAGRALDEKPLTKEAAAQKVDLNFMLVTSKTIGREAVSSPPPPLSLSRLNTRHY